MRLHKEEVRNPSFGGGAKDRMIRDNCIARRWNEMTQGTEISIFGKSW